MYWLSCVIDEIKRKQGQNGCVEYGQEIYLEIRINAKGTLLNISKTKINQQNIENRLIKSDTHSESESEKEGLMW